MVQVEVKPYATKYKVSDQSIRRSAILNVNRDGPPNVVWADDARYLHIAILTCRLARVNS